MYNGMALDTDVIANTALPGVVPQSPPNVAAFGGSNAVTLLQGTPALTTVYADSTISFLDFHYFYFGCVLADKNGLASAPQSCTLTVRGRDTNGNVVATQQFSFTQNGLQQQMIKATLNSAFVRLQSAEFEVEPVGALAVSNATVDAIADNFSYTVYSTQFLSS